MTKATFLQLAKAKQFKAVTYLVLQYYQNILHQIFQKIKENYVTIVSEEWQKYSVHGYQLETDSQNLRMG